jgi:hypothetical protein
VKFEQSRLSEKARTARACRAHYLILFDRGTGQEGCSGCDHPLQIPRKRWRRRKPPRRRQRRQILPPVKITFTIEGQKKIQVASKGPQVRTRRASSSSSLTENSSQNAHLLKLIGHEAKERRKGRRCKYTRFIGTLGGNSMYRTRRYLRLHMGGPSWA